MIRQLIKRVAATTLWPKLAVGIALWLGVPWLWTGTSAAVLAAIWGIWYVRKGIREQYHEPEAEGYARRWENLVWDNSRWINPETPDEGVVRLANPWRQQCQSSVNSARSTRARKSTRRSVRSALASIRAAQGNSLTTLDSAPHFLPMK